MDLPRAARASLWAGDLEGVREALVAIDAADLHGRVLDVDRRAIRAALSAHDGDRDHAAQEYAAILPELAEMGLVYKQAHVVLDMALVLGPDEPIVRASVDEARAILERLGARPFSARLDELMGGRPLGRSGRSRLPTAKLQEATSEAGLP